MKEIIATHYMQTFRNSLFSGFRLLLAAVVLQALMTGTVQAQAPDYDALDEVLARNIRNGYVDYDGIADEPGFSEFIEKISTTRPAELASTEDLLAFYINAYNALAIQGILDGQSPSSWWGRRKFFGQKKHDVLGETISLEMLEHERIHELGEHRVHFAIVCASISCPRLSSRAYRPESLNTQLHEAAKRFINDPVRNRFDSKRKTAYISKIFEWYADDFIAAGGSLQRYLARFASDATVQDMLRQDSFDIKFVDYDWNLNGRYSGNK